MFVESVKQINKSKYKIFLSEDIAFMCYKGDVSRFKIKEGCELSDTVWTVIHDEVLPQRALNRLLGLLTSRDYTQKMLYDKLISDGYPSDISHGAVDKVVSYGYVNDYNYASMYLHDYGRSKSMNSMKRELIKRGVPEDILDKATDNYLAEYGDNEKDKIMALLIKRHFDFENSTYEQILKQKRYLLSKGYSYETVNKCLGRDSDLFEQLF